MCLFLFCLFAKELKTIRLVVEQADEKVNNVHRGFCTVGRTKLTGAKGTEGLLLWLDTL